ncbi:MULTISPECIES: LysR family transcriptional regulator [unclassified Ruegeria]|uniref:LysR family transcriptional regulator n=1 Tax=unclassified Ruegeria TaxID=2625375 RepID=UPI001ADD3CBD|nr:MULTISPECIES: LysR family transcriptional regulator [unclassified Ruegeria]MBO9412699.1 LysR family transcriptional regulator [Ruegeria sp. R8_1]MBO9416753.1 LysR family transcriptional regulator [Ruegeria sp. R8_2]
MAKTLPPLTWFRSFEAAARRLSSTAAADEIGLTQSAVSQQIRALETRLGVVLFHRHARGLSLTDEGRKLLPQVEAALEMLETAASPYLTEEKARHITVAASISIIEWVIAPALPAFQAQHPETSVRFVSTIWPDEYAAARADVEIRFGSAKQVGKDAVALQPNRLVPVKSPALEGEALPLIESVGTSDSWTTWAEATGQTMGTPTYFVDSYGLALQMAASGNGVALVNQLIAAHALRSGQVMLASDHSAPATEGYFLAVQRRSTEIDAFTGWFSDLLRV